MATTQNGRIAIDIKSTLASVLDLSTVSDQLAKLWEFVLMHGVGANQANALWHDSRMIPTAGSEDLDLGGVGGSPVVTLVDGLGETVVLTRLKALFIKASAANDGDLVVTRPAATGVPLFIAAGDGMAITPGGCLLLVAPDADGIPVSAAAGLLTVTNSGASDASYDIVVIGTL